MVLGRTKIVEKILQKINCVSSCSKMGANICPSLKKGDAQLKHQKITFFSREMLICGIFFSNRIFVCPFKKNKLTVNQMTSLKMICGTF